MMSLSRSFIYLLLAAATLLAQTAPKQAQAPKPAPKMAPTVPPKKSSTSMVTVTVTTDLACSFGIDGKAQADLGVGESRKVLLSLREHKLEAVSAAANQDRWQGTIDLSKADTKSVVNVELLPIQNKRLEEERKAEEEKKTKEEKIKAEEYLKAYQTSLTETGRLLPYVDLNYVNNGTLPLILGSERSWNGRIVFGPQGVHEKKQEDGNTAYDASVYSPADGHIDPIQGRSFYVLALIERLDNEVSTPIREFFREDLPSFWTDDTGSSPHIPLFIIGVRHEFRVPISLPVFAKPDPGATVVSHGVKRHFGIRDGNSILNMDRYPGQGNWIHEEELSFGEISNNAAAWLIRPEAYSTLILEVTNKGYKYVSGRGNIVLPNGQSITYPPRSPSE